MIDITIEYGPGEYDIARQLRKELEDRMGEYPANVWIEES